MNSRTHSSKDRRIHRLAALGQLGLVGLIGFGAQACLPGLPDVCTFECTAAIRGQANLSTGPGTITVSAAGSLSTTEAGGTAVFTVALSRQPTAGVSLSLASDDISEGVPAPATLAFSAADWNTPRTVTVTGVDDGLLDGSQNYSILIAAAESTDAGYAGVDPDDVPLTNLDDDTPGVLLTQTGGATAAIEGGATDSYSMELTSQPTANVTVTITPDAQVTANASAIPINEIFTTGACPGPGDWCVARTISIAAVDDAFAEGAHSGLVTHAAVSADPNYNAIAIPNVSVALTDDDVAGVTLVESGGSSAATEGGANDSYSLVLESQPVADVTVTLTPDAQVRANSSVAPINLSFTAGACPGPGNWCTSQTVTVAAADDAFAEGPHSGVITHSVASADGDYNGIALANVNTAISDDDVASIVVSESGGSTGAVEGAASSDAYTVVLTAQPTANVTLTITPDAQVSANASTVPINLNFTSGACPGPGDWCVPQTVNVAARDDAIAEGAHTGAFTHSAASADADYNGIAVGTLTANITDDDVASVSITESGGATSASEAGATDSYSIVLTSQPLADVTISITPDAQMRANGSATAINLSFTAGACPGPGTWCTGQTVTGSANDDGSVEGTHAGSFAHAATSADPAYNGVGIAGVTASIVDNDRFTFHTAAVHDGDFDNDATLGGNGDGSGVAEADQFCMIDANRPSADTYKALLVKSPLGGGPQRRASQNPNAGDGQIDWVLAPNINYYRADGSTLVFSTNANGLFVFGAAANSFAATPGDYWTGLAPDWRVTPPLQSCGGWSANGGVNGRTGQGTAVNADAISQASTGCGATAHLICIQQ
ncbi:MAG: DUF1554 domain-containing protein [bacterium]|nr:DUF1554 domain-containing protein [bacterium]